MRAFMNLRAAAALVLALLFLNSSGRSGYADFVVLKSGGEIRGELQRNSNGAESSVAVSVRTLTGAVVTVARDDVQSVTRRRLILEQYETFRRLAASDIDSQWKLAEW